jgi:hypothetical protein
MLAILHTLAIFIYDLLKSGRRLQAENLFLRHHLTIALRRAPPRPRLCGSDRALLVWMTRICPRLLDLAQVVKPETILRWHRAGFKAFWRWKCRNRAGRPKVDRGLRDLTQRMSRENPLWGRECLDHVLIIGAQHLRQVLASYATYYNQTRTHLTLEKDAPLGRPVQQSGRIVAIPILSGLHHQYVRI